MDFRAVLKVIAIVIQLIASGLSEGDAISKTAAKLDLSESFIRNIFYR